jgi:hypothetical protein
MRDDSRRIHGGEFVARGPINPNGYLARKYASNYIEEVDEDARLEQLTPDR